MERQQRAIRSRKAILRAAAQVVDRHGLTAATLSRVSTEAGLSTGAIYFHFADKDALVSALEQEAANALDELVAGRAREMAPALTAMVEMTRELARLLARDVVVRAGFQVSCDRAEGGVPVLRRRLTTLLTQLLEVARSDGSLTPGVAVDEITVTILAITIGVQILSRQPDTTQTAALAMERFWQAILPELTDSAHSDGRSTAHDG